MKGFDLLAILLNHEFSAMLLHGLRLTMVIAVGSWLLAMTLALLLLTLRLTPSRIAERAVEAYVSYHRNVPTLVQLMLWYFGIASLLPNDMQAWFSVHQAEAVFAGGFLTGFEFIAEGEELFDFGDDAVLFFGWRDRNCTLPKFRVTDCGVGNALHLGGDDLLERVAA